MGYKAGNRYFGLRSNNKDLTLNIDKSYSNIDTIKQLPLKKIKEKVIILSDVANIEFGPVSEKTLFKAQRKNAVNLKTVGIHISIQNLDCSGQ